ncbi:peptidylprolyl isomerase [Alienimonas californiensis]|uniref:Peptidyl-prolyl cis-trans isomerase D n=1 Tax=Alienimonas californiensis TaxID=2527989 RepID=A0A517P9A6_9PLAN|nr:peptidyl-prolyl cis-trans isomerase [Alienimonas californiensis]QDT15957.1 Peptidyl-prolyl cis-trans isomerase D [Alienimonas californiensis]
MARPASALALSAAAICFSLTAPGCAALKQKWDEAVATDVDNPVVPKKPKRIPGAVASVDTEPTRSADALSGAADGSAAGSSAIELVEGRQFEPNAPQHFEDADVVATVNGEPLLAGDLLQFEIQLSDAAARIAAAPDADEAVPGGPPGLTAAQRAMLTAQIDAARAKILAERLPAKIEEALLAQRMRRTLKAEQLEKLNEAVGTLFDQTELPEMLRKANVQAVAAGRPPIQSKEELRRLMAEQGLDMDAVVAAWKPQQMAMAYVEQNTGMASIRISRQEVQDYYDAHREDFTPPKAARWEQIEVPYENDAGRSAALDVVEAAAGELRRGRPFAEVAKTYSRGLNAQEGGRWDWTAPDALPNKKLSAALWNQPVGEVGAAFDCPLSPDGFPPGGAYHIVRVIERRGDVAPPLDDLRDQIENKIKGERRREAVASLIAQERAAAQIEVYVRGTKWPPEE